MGLEFLIFPRLFIMNECWILSNAFSASKEMVMLVFFFEFVYTMDCIDGFLCSKPSLHPWNETYLVRMDDCFDVFLDSFSENFIDYFCIDIHKGN